jgi:hypothetical protein
MPTIKDGAYNISLGGNPPFLTVKIKGDVVTYTDGSTGPVSTIAAWEMEGINATEKS